MSSLLDSHNRGDKPISGAGLIYTYIHKKDMELKEDGGCYPPPLTDPPQPAAEHYTVTYDREEKGGCLMMLEIIGYLFLLWLYFHVLAVLLWFFL
jgi:hypothetical protein